MKFRSDKPVKQRSGLVRLLFVVIPIIIAMLAVSLFSLYRWYDSNLEPVDPNQTEAQTFVVEPGDSVRSIASDLKMQGLIRNSTAFSWYVGRSSEYDELQAGTYSLSPAMSVEMIVDKLAGGEIDTSQITIFPGRRLDELQEDFIDRGFTPGEVQAALAASYQAEILRDRPAGATLEGYIFPETYQITADSDLQDIIQRALDEFSERVDAEIQAALATRGLNLHEAITLASIVAKESSVPETQRRIAGVFFNRLDEGMNLGADPTFRYAAAISGQTPSPDIDSPYNTRIYGGLPPGPIANFNFSALEAVANPIESNFLFFVAGDDGQTYFSRTAAEHQQNVDLHCDENCRIIQ